MPPSDQPPQPARVYYDVAEMFDRLRRDMSEQHGRVIELLGTKADKADLLAVASRFDGSLDGLRGEVRAVTGRVDEIEAQHKAKAAAQAVRDEAADLHAQERSRRAEVWQRVWPFLLAVTAIASFLWSVMHG